MCVLCNSTLLLPTLRDGIYSFAYDLHIGPQNGVEVTKCTTCSFLQHYFCYLKNPAGLLGDKSHRSSHPPPRHYLAWVDTEEMVGKVIPKTQLAGHIPADCRLLSKSLKTDHTQPRSAELPGGPQAGQLS